MGAVENQGTASFDHDTFRGNQAAGGATTDGADVTPNTIYGSVFGAAFWRGNRRREPSTLCVSSCSSPATRRTAASATPSSQSDGVGYDGVADSGAISNGIPPSSPTRRSPATSRSAAQPAPGVDGGFGIGGTVGSGGPFARSTAMTIRRCVFNQTLPSARTPDPAISAGFGVGGALTNGYSEAGSTMTITDSMFSANQATGGNGGFPWRGGRRGHEPGVTLHDQHRQLHVRM